MKDAEIEQLKSAEQIPAGGRMESRESEAVRKIGQSIIYMLRHLNEPLQVATLAAQASISPSHFFALFKRQVGCAPIDYFIRLRMQQACRLLDETALSVKEVAAAVGYDDPFYFSRVFKSVNRVAPSEYRQLKQASQDALFGAFKNTPSNGSSLTNHIDRKGIQPSRRVAPPAYDSVTLSPREREVLELLAYGYLYKEVADNLGITIATVVTYIRRIYEKLQVHSRAQAVAKYRYFAPRRGLK
jgi:AraC-like DNA-binding protein/DNA-binding CsgD family transcriptional regulator